MKDYATFVMFGALCVFGCASTEDPSTQTGSSTSAGTGVPAANAGTPSVAPGGAGRPATSPSATAGSTASAGAPASAAAGSGATQASSGTAGVAAAAGSGGAAPGSGAVTPAKGSFLAAYTLALRDMCMSCHNTGGLFSSPDFATPDKAYASLVDKDASTMAPGQCGGKGKLVTPGNCETSLVYNKITQMTPMCGRRMPLSSDTMPQLIPQAGLDALCDWIKAGAKKDP
jgi:hypothetical protein